MRKCKVCGKDLPKYRKVVCSYKCNGELTRRRLLGKCGKNSKHWQGGEIIIGNRVWVYDPQHPNAKYNHNYVVRSRWLMSKKIGRAIRRNEDVHHINGDRTDDRIENLVLLTHKAHGKLLKHTEATKQIIRECTAKQRRLRGKFIPNCNTLVV